VQVHILSRFLTQEVSMRAGHGVEGLFCRLGGQPYPVPKVQKVTVINPGPAT